jgi:DNA repair protein RecN (Recombination protein N)
MLSTLSIRDVVLIDRLDLAFPHGLCALTGETGAGKSILLDALGLALGGRADSRMIRHGCEQASVAALFRISSNHPVLGILREQGVGVDGEDGLLVRRVVSRDGRSRAFVNDQPVGVALIRRLGEALVEVHGQFESQRLLEPATHRSLLDAYAGLTPMAEACAAAWAERRRVIAAREAAAADVAAARRDEDYLRHALDELDALDPQEDEEERLAHQRVALQHAEKLASALAEAAETLSGGGGRGVGQMVNGALRLLQRNAGPAEGRLDAVVASLEQAGSELIEAQALLEKLQADVGLDPRRLEQVEERLFALRRMARKHDVAVAELPRVRAEVAARLQRLDQGGEALAHLTAEAKAAEERYRRVAEALGAARREAAGRLDAGVAAELAPLKLGKARFVTRIEALPAEAWGEYGGDRVEFEVATNPGVPPGPLAKVASGGELARFMLALKVVLARADPVPTLVFDEVDAGIGGAVAAAVGERLARLAENVQVLVVTHSPQVAARGDHHWRIAKAEVEGCARTSVDVLGAADRREEIARMLAGAKVTDEARAAADSLLLGQPA